MKTKRSEICAILVTLKRSNIMTMQGLTQHLCGKKPDPAQVISFLVCKAPCGLHPTYFVDLLSLYSPAANLHSCQAGCLLSSLHNLSAPAAWANSSAAPAVWTHLPVHLHLHSFSPPSSSPSPLHEWHHTAQQCWNTVQTKRRTLVKIKPLEIMWYYPAHTVMEQETQQDDSSSKCNFQDEEKLSKEPAQSPYQAQRLLHSLIHAACHPAWPFSCPEKALRNFHWINTPFQYQKTLLCS